MAAVPFLLLLAATSLLQQSHCPTPCDMAALLQGQEALSSLTRLELCVEWAMLSSYQRQQEGGALRPLSALTSLRCLKARGCFTNPLPPCALSCSTQLTALALEVPLSWGSGGLLELSGQHLGTLTRLRALSLHRVALAVTAAEAGAWHALQRLLLSDVALPAGPGGSVLGALPALQKLAAVTVVWGAARCDAASVRSSLSACTGLQELDLILYPLATLPTLHHQLTSLRLAQAAVCNPPRGSLGGLQRLELSHCRAQPWLPMLGSLSRLRRLRVERCGLGGGLLLAALSTLEALEEVVLDSADLAASSAPAAELLSCHS